MEGERFLTSALGPSRDVLVLIASCCLHLVSFLSVAKYAFAFLLKQHCIFFKPGISKLLYWSERRIETVLVCSLLETM